MAVPVDPAALRLVLERQLALLTPVADHLGDPASIPSPLPPDDWSGPAAQRAAATRAELSGRMRDAEALAREALRRVRAALGALS